MVTRRLEQKQCIRKRVSEVNSDDQWKEQASHIPAGLLLVKCMVASRSAAAKLCNEPSS